MAKKRSGFFGRLFSMAFSLPGLAIMVVGAFVVAFIGGKAKEMVDGLATKAKSLTGKSEG